MNALEIQPFISEAFGFLSFISTPSVLFYVVSSTVGQGRHGNRKDRIPCSVEGH